MFLNILSSACWRNRSQEWNYEETLEAIFSFYFKTWSNRSVFSLLFMPLWSIACAGVYSEMLLKMETHLSKALPKPINRPIALQLGMIIELKFIEIICLASDLKVNTGRLWNHQTDMVNVNPFPSGLLSTLFGFWITLHSTTTIVQCLPSIVLIYVTSMRLGSMVCLNHQQQHQHQAV